MDALCVRPSEDVEVVRGPLGELVRRDAAFTVDITVSGPVDVDGGRIVWDGCPGDGASRFNRATSGVDGGSAVSPPRASLIDMDALFRRMPVDLLSVPAADFAAVLNAAAARFAADRSDRFAAGALACAQWIAGITEDHPIRDGREPCTVEGMESCQMLADAVVYEMPHAPSGID